MIVALLTILSIAGPVAQLRSVEVFPSAAACEAWLEADAANRAAFALALRRRLGEPVTVDARCLDLAPGGRA
jgi:hypothetical protein